MKKITCFILVSLLLLPQLSVSAQNYDGVPVEVAIESYDKTITRGKINAFTFEEAINKLAAQKKIELVFTHLDNHSAVFSANGIQNGTFDNSSETERWLGFVIRNNTVWLSDDYLSMPLEPNDQVVLYYGDSGKTRILSEIRLQHSGGTLTFHAVSCLSDDWPDANATEDLAGVNIHLYIPNQSQKVLKTNQNGLCSVTLPSLGLYQYYAEAYVFGDVPSAVRTKDYYYLHGIKDENEVTRSEAIAFVINSFPYQDTGENNAQPETKVSALSDTSSIAVLENAGMPQPVFSDLADEMDFYEEIIKGISLRAVHGYPDGTLRPQAPITQLELAILLAGLYPETLADYLQTADSGNDSAPAPASLPDSVAADADGDLPAYAQAYVKTVLQDGLFDQEKTDWYGAVTSSALQEIYFRYSTSKP